jgi:DNA-binding transcriptional MerR regulator
MAGGEGSTDAPRDLRSAPALSVAAVARRLGVAPATLRTWDRRYDLGPSEHLAGSHRRYTSEDLARLMVMRRLTLEGVAPSEAARVARESEPQEDRPLADVHHLGGAAAIETAGRTTPAVLVDAALRGDEETTRRLVAPRGPDDLTSWWTELVEPVRAALAARTVLARPGEDPAHLFDAAVLAGLRSLGSPTTHIAGRRVVLLMAAPDEVRPVALHAMAGALVAHRVDARVVVGPLDPHRVTEIAAMARPAAAVVLTEQDAPDLDVVSALVAAAPELPVFVGVPDAAAARVPLGRTVVRSRSFAGLLHEVLAVST